MSPSQDVQVTSSESLDNLADELSEISVEDLIRSYLVHNENPTDAQIHLLADLVGLPYQDFEGVIYKLFGEYVGDAADDVADDSDSSTDEDDAGDVAEELEEDGEPISALDVFIVSYFMRNPEPSDTQIHLLAQAVGMEPEALEEHLYNLLSDLVSSDEDDDDESF
jgi:hypothetical protein